MTLAGACALPEVGDDPEAGDLIAAGSTQTTLGAVADAWVRSGSSVNSNKGTDAMMSIDKLDSNGAERRGYVMFEVPAGITVTSARVELYCSRGANRGGDLRRAPATWTETGLTWNNQPALGTIVSSRTSSVTTGTWVRFDVSAVVAGPGRYAFSLTTPSTEEVRYATREAGQAPRLVITSGSTSPTGPDAGMTPDAPTSTPDASTPPPPPPPSSGDYLLIKRADLMALSTTNAAFARLKAYADATWPAPSLDDQDRKHGTYVLAAAMIYARTGTTAYRDKARAGIMAAIGTESASTTRTLALGRQVASYVLAADFIRLDGADQTTFKSWVSAIRTRKFPTHSRWDTLAYTHDDSANNWGAFAGASMIAASLYLGDTTDVLHRVRVVKGFLGDRTAWNDFRGQDEKNSGLSDDDRTWACDASPSGFVPTNPPCVRNGINLDGAIVADAVRGGPLQFPVPGEGIGYTNETFQGLFFQLELLHQAGYSLWTHNNNAARRAGDFLSRTNGWNYHPIQTGNPWLANKRLGTTYPRVTPSNSRLLMGYDWLWGP